MNTRTILKLRTKIHSLGHYLKYAWKSKTKFRIHSPYVFSFITHILEGKQEGYDGVAKSLYTYYKKHSNKVNLALNAGAGSQEVKNQLYRPQELIHKLGLPDKYGKILYALVKDDEIERVIELGTSIGTSAAFMAAAGNKPIVSIDANPEVLASTKQAFDTIMPEHQIEFVQAYFDDVLDQVIQGSLKHTLVFIDGDHNKEAVLRYFNTCLQFAEQPAVIVFDDIYWSEGMTEAWQEICIHPKVKLSIDLYRIGIVFFREESLTKEHFQLWY